MTAAVIAAILKEKLTLKSPDEIDTVVRNPDTGSTVPMNLENANRSWGRPRVEECGDARAHDDRDEEARPKSSVFRKLFFATCPLRRRMKRPWTTLAFRPRV